MFDAKRHAVRGAGAHDVHRRRHHNTFHPCTASVQPLVHFFVLVGAAGMEEQQPEPQSVAIGYAALRIDLFCDGR